MARLDHLGLSVTDLATTRDWYVATLGLEVEFDAGQAAGLKDQGDFTLILVQDGQPASRCNLYFQIEDVSVSYEDMTSRGVVFSHPPQPNGWGYGAGLIDPDGRYVGLWDEKSMSQRSAH